MKYTLLGLVQKALSYIDDTNVSSVDETEESEQLVHIANKIYGEIVTYPWPHMRSIGSLSTTATAHIMILPTTVMGIEWIRYNGDDVSYITPYEMEKKLKDRDTSLDNVDANGALNDQDPTYWTTNDDENIIFDSYNSSLVSNLSRCSFISTVSELSADADYPDLPERFHTVLLDGIIADAFRTLKRDAYIAAIWEKKYQMGIAKMKRWARRVDGKESTYGTNYARHNVQSPLYVKVIDASL